MTITSVEPLELSQLLGSLLSSIVQAQAQSARATVEFVEEVGLEAGEGTSRMRTVTLRYSKKDENGKPAEFEVEVPLLALVNVPSLAVSDAKLEFSYDVVSAVADTSSPAPTPLPGRKTVMAKLTGLIRRPPAQQAGPSQPGPQQTTSLDVVVNLKQQEIPVGVSRLFDLAELGISEKPAGELPPGK